ncbi:hypothetical protein AKO1_006403, partial [Acrasis kona]
MLSPGSVLQYNASNIPDSFLEDVRFAGLVTPVMDHVHFVDDDAQGFDLDRINRVINNYYHLSEYIITWYQSIIGKNKYIRILSPFSFVPMIRRYRNKIDVLPPDMMSTGDIGIFININNKIVVADPKKIIEMYPQYVHLYCKYKTEYYKMKTKKPFIKRTRT